MTVGRKDSMATQENKPESTAYEQVHVVARCKIVHGAYLSKKTEWRCPPTAPDIVYSAVGGEEKIRFSS